MLLYLNDQFCSLQIETGECEVIQTNQDGVESCPEPAKCDQLLLVSYRPGFLMNYDELTKQIRVLVSGNYQKGLLLRVQKYLHPQIRDFSVLLHQQI